MNLYSIIFVIFNIHHLCYASYLIPFLSDFFRFKNAKTIWVVSCTTGYNKMLAEWRKNSVDMISLQSISVASDLFSLLPDHEPKEMVGLSIDLSCDSSHVITKLQTEDAIKKKMLILLWSNDHTRVHHVAISHLLSVGFTDPFFAVFSSNSHQILVFNGNDLAMIWDDHNGLVVLETISRPRLSGKIVRGMITLKDERRHKTDKLLDILEEKSWETVDDNLMKFSFVLHQFLEKMYDFQWQLHLSGSQAVDEVYMSRSGSLDYFMNGSQFGALKSGYVDVGLYPAELLPAALDSFEILPPFTTFRQYFVFSSPITVLEPYVVYSIFSGEVWLVTFGLALLMAMVTTVSAQTRKSSNIEEDKELTFMTNVLIAVGAFAQQGLERSSEKLSVRICHFFLLFLTLMLFMFYNTGFLIYTLNPTQKELKSFKELLSKGFTIAAEDTPYNRFQLQGNYSHPSEWFHHNCQGGWGNCRTELDFYNLSVGTEMLMKKKTAFFGYASNIYGVLGDITTDREQSNLRELPVHKPYLVSTFVRKHFPYKELFTRGLVLLKEAGITHHEDQKWNFKKPDPLMDSYFVIASLYSTSVAFVLLFSGILGSFLLLLLEIFAKQDSAVKLGRVMECFKRTFNSNFINK